MKLLMQDNFEVSCPNCNWKRDWKNKEGELPMEFSINCPECKKKIFVCLTGEVKAECGLVVFDKDKNKEELDFVEKAERNKSKRPKRKRNTSRRKTTVKK